MVVMKDRRASVPARRRDVARLIELGRDREAAELGAEHRRGDRSESRRSGSRGEDVDVLAQLDQLGPTLGRVVAGIQPDQLDHPTPCAHFTVRGVLEHMIGGATVFAAAFRGEEPPSSPPDDHSRDVLAEFGVTLTALAAAMHQQGALERTIQAPFGEVPGTEFARYVVLDGLVHGWDLCVATGQAYAPSDALVAEADAYARETIDSLRDGQTFAAATEPPAGATPIERLAAFTGRRV
jgi:uncharacterized protein (TIGR03086 family)